MEADLTRSHLDAGRIVRLASSAETKPTCRRRNDFEGAARLRGFMAKANQVSIPYVDRSISWNYRSTAKPIALPPPRQSAAMPLCTSRRIIS